MTGSAPVESNPPERTRDARPEVWALLGGLSFLVFAAHMLVSGRYGYFVDELYYLACSHHLAWGYVDQPPLIAVITWLERVTLGDSLSALHFLPAVAAGLRVLLAGLIARELGARRFGTALACVCVAVAPIYLGLDSILTMNVFESLFWMSAALVVLKIFNGASQKLWLLFGAICGVGLLNKHSMLIFGFGLFVGLLLTPQRKQFAKPWIWLGALLALLIFLPNLLWEIQRHFPTAELLRNVQQSGRNTEMGPGMFLLVQAFILHPLAAPVWIAGLFELLRDRHGKGWRVLGITYVVLMICMLTMHGRMYYPAPAYPMLFAAGGLAFERWFATLKKRAMAEARVYRVAAGDRPDHRAVCVFPDADRGSVHRLFAIHAPASATHRKQSSWVHCRKFTPINSAGKKWRKSSPMPITSFHPKSRSPAGYLLRITAKPAPSISSAQKWVCLPPFPVTRTIFIGDRVATPAIV